MRRNTTPSTEFEKMFHGLTALPYGLSLRPGHALRITAIALGSVVLIAAVTFELFAIAIAISS